MIEQVHSETYSLLIETYVRDQEEKDFLFNGMENSTSILHAFSIVAVRSVVYSSRLRRLETELMNSTVYQEEGRLGSKVYHRRAGMSHHPLMLQHLT